MQKLGGAKVKADGCVLEEERANKIARLAALLYSDQVEALLEYVHMSFYTPPDQSIHWGHLANVSVAC